MLHPSTKRLIDKLSEMTRKQRVTWTEGEHATVVHDTEGYRVVITPDPHTVLLTDALGREIETCTPEEFADDVDSHGRPYAKFIAELYREAARHARGTEKAIRTLLAGLDSVEAEPPAAVAAAPVLHFVDAPDATTDETAPIESETEITAAVATLADQINGTPPAAEAEIVAAPEPEPEPAPEPVMAAPAPEPESVPEPEPEPAPTPEAVAAPVVEAAVEAPAPSVEVAPLAEEPGSFGTFGAFEHMTAEAAAEPAPEVLPAFEPEPEPMAVEVAPMVDVAPEPVVAELAPEPEPSAPPAPEPAPAVPTLSQPISLSSIPFGFGLGAAQRMGAPSHPSTTPPEPEPQVSADAPKRLVIDGTLDLPDMSPGELDELAAADIYPPPAPQTDPLELPGENAPPAPEPGSARRFNPWN